VKTAQASRRATGKTCKAQACLCLIEEEKMEEEV